MDKLKELLDIVDCDNIVEILTIEFPILFTFEEEGKLQIGYTLMYDRFTNEFAVYTVEVKDVQLLISVLNGDLPLIDILKPNNNIYGFVYSDEVCGDGSAIEDIFDLDYVLPNEEFTLSARLPNKVSISNSIVEIGCKYL